MQVFVIKFNSIFVVSLPTNEKETYIDKSVNYHTKIVNYNHEHRNISIIDDKTKKKIFELKETKKSTT